MSQWTHVAGVIRFNALRLDQIEGRETNGVGKSHPCHTMPLLPEGSEGPLTVEIHENPSLNAMAAYVAVVFGDLRDYSDVNEIRQFFTKWAEKNHVRQACFEIDVEYQDYRVYNWNDEDKLFEEHVPHQPL